MSLVALSLTGRAGWTGAALDWLDAFIGRRAATPAQAALLRLAVEEGREQATTLPNGLPAAELPLLVYAAAGGRGEPPLPLAGGCLCVYLGADVFDNVADQELPPRWAEHGPARASLAGVTLLAPFAALALGELEAGQPTRLALHQALAEALAEMAAGQAADLAFERREDVSLEACEAMVLAKSGAELAFFARAGAILAGAPAAVGRAYADFGRHLGAAGQISSDCHDLFTQGGEASHDLAAGKRTLPIVHALATLTTTERSELLAHLDAAPRDPERAEAAQRLLLASGALELGALAADTHRRTALAALRAAGPAGPPAEALCQYVEELALFGAARQPSPSSSRA